MTFWGFYFIAKSYLNFRGILRLDLVFNLVLFAAVMLPMRRDTARQRSWSAARLWAGAVLAAALLWRESWLPSASELLTFLSASGPKVPFVYVLRFLAGAFDPVEIALVTAILLACMLAVRKGLRLTFPALAMLCLAGVQNLGAASQAVGRTVAEFREAESRRIIRMPPPSGPAFDLVVIHACSLSWDDLQEAGLEGHRLFDRFDLRLDNFNTVATYSTPSALRLLRASCGQAAHGALYDPWPNECYLLQQLRTRGYHTYTALNHPGRSRDMAMQLANLARADAPMYAGDLPAQLVNFDDEPIYPNFEVLKRWWNARQASGAPRAFLYYHTMTLHGGSHAPEPGWWKQSRTEIYRKSLDMLSDDLDAFYAQLAASGRNVVVLFVPDHGSALRGSLSWPQGLLEIPLPQITLVPVGVKFIGRGKPAWPAVLRTQAPVSYSALAQLLAGFLARSPFGAGSAKAVAKAVADMPQTRFLGENQDASVVRIDDEFFLHGKERKWIKLQKNMVRVYVPPKAGS